MWPFSDTSATTRDALSLWRETNGLLRELVEAIKGAPAETRRVPWTPRPGRPLPLPDPTRRKLSDRDVTHVSRETLHALQQEAAAKQAHPHREAAAAHIPRVSSTPETSGALPPVDPQIAELNAVTLDQMRAVPPLERQSPTFPLTAPIRIVSANLPIQTLSDPSAAGAAPPPAPPPPSPD